MEKNIACSECAVRSCRWDDEAYPSFCTSKNMDPALIEEAMNVYRDNPEDAELSRVSACIEGDFYGKLTRVEETIEFIRRMGFKKVGIASCVGLLPEAGILAKILRASGIECIGVGCKLGIVDKTELGVPNEKKLNGGCGHESMCNPVLQAKYLAAQGCDFNIVMGLCVGHDTLFFKYSEAPTTVMVVKDRVTGHNPVQTLYLSGGMYSRFKKELKVR